MSHGLSVGEMSARDVCRFKSLGTRVEIGKSLLLVVGWVVPPTLARGFHRVNRLKPSLRLI